MKDRWALAPAFIAALILVFSQSAFAEKAAAVLKGTDPNSPLAGSARFEDTDDGLQVEVNVFSAPPGLHGIHIHEKGSCEDKGNAAGGHFNPDGTSHGLITTDGFAKAHPGDLGNIEIDENGEGMLFLVVPGLTIHGGKYDIGSHAVILHEKEDNFGQPTGNAGGRIACGVIESTQEQH